MSAAVFREAVDIDVDVTCWLHATVAQLSAVVFLINAKGVDQKELPSESELSLKLRLIHREDL